MHQVEVVAADQLIRVVAKLPLDRLALIDRDAVRTDQRDVVGRVLDERFVQLRRSGACRPAPPSPTVMSSAMPTSRRPPSGGRSAPTTMSRSQTVRPSAAMHSVFELVVLAAACRLPAEGRTAIDVVRMGVAHPEVRVVQPVTHRIAEDSLGLLADEGEMEGFGLGFPDDGAETVDQREQLLRREHPHRLQQAPPGGAMIDRPKGRPLDAPADDCERSRALRLLRLRGGDCWIESSSPAGSRFAGSRGRGGACQPPPIQFVNRSGTGVKHRIRMISASTATIWRVRPIGSCS